MKLVCADERDVPVKSHFSVSSLTPAGLAGIPIIPFLGHSAKRIRSQSSFWDFPVPWDG
jgi:hypothetical protein